MPDPNSISQDFLERAKALVLDHIGDEQFGVSGLARQMGMSRSNLLRKVKKNTGISVSQFIRQIRLEEGMKLLKLQTLTVSEVSYEVGFNSVSYFIKCFHDQYGYPPGEVGKQEFPEDENSKKKRWVDAKVITIGTLVLFGVMLAIVLLFFNPFTQKPVTLEKSIAVLPFKNDSNDSTNIYIINGLMESLLNNLQQIRDLRVVSRTSVEKYRNHSKTIPQIGKELDVSYFVEGSGQKVGDQIMLNIQLIEASTDRHLWSEQFTREAKDIFTLQQEVAKKIADRIQVVITPEEAQRIEKIPTDDLVAYDFFLKGLDLMYKGGGENLLKAIEYYQKAIEKDPEFARAYAGTAITYFFMDTYQVEKRFSQEINFYADKALLLDPQLPQSLIAKALYYLHGQDNDRAVEYLEKALEYNPNSALVINILADFYTRYRPNTGKYLEYALKGLRLDKSGADSVSTSFTYLHISNAFVQTGFVEEAEKYIDESLAYDLDNIYSRYVKAYILYAKNKDLNQTLTMLEEVLSIDTFRLDVMQEVAKISYFMKDYDKAYKHYSRFVELRAATQPHVYPEENAKIGMVMAKTGRQAEAEEFFELYAAFSEQDNSLYKDLNLAVSYACKNDQVKTMEHLNKFCEQDNFHYWTILFLDVDPVFEGVKDLPEFKRVKTELEKKFWVTHEKIRSSLEKEGLL